MLGITDGADRHDAQPIHSPLEPCAPAGAPHQGARRERSGAKGRARGTRRLHPYPAPEGLECPFDGAQRRTGSRSPAERTTHARGREGAELPPRGAKRNHGAPRPRGADAGGEDAERGGEGRTGGTTRGNLRHTAADAHPPPRGAPEQGHARRRKAANRIKAICAPGGTECPPHTRALNRGRMPVFCFATGWNKHAIIRTGTEYRDSG